MHVVVKKKLENSYNWSWFYFSLDDKVVQGFFFNDLLRNENVRWLIQKDDYGWYLHLIYLTSD